MKFLVQELQEDQNFTLIYRDEDYSFDIEPYNGTGFTSIMINDLQLEIDDKGKIIYVWGLCPLIQHKETKEVPQKYKTRSLIVLLDKPLVPGISHRLNIGDRWPTYINKREGWVCLGNPEIKDKQLVEFAPCCVATIDNQKLIAIWLQPEELPKNLIPQIVSV